MYEAKTFLSEMSKVKSIQQPSRSLAHFISVYIVYVCISVGAYTHMYDELDYERPA